jgi:hypothetical protein
MDFTEWIGKNVIIELPVGYNNLTNVLLKDIVTTRDGFIQGIITQHDRIIDEETQHVEHIERFIPITSVIVISKSYSTISLEKD